MMQTILLRKYDVPSQKHAKRIIDQARKNLDCDSYIGDGDGQSTNVLWSKELEDECARVWRRSEADERVRKEAERAVPDVKPVVYHRPSLGLSATAHHTSRGTNHMSSSPARQRRASTTTSSASAVPPTNIGIRRSPSPFKRTDDMSIKPIASFSQSMSSPKKAVKPVSALPQPIVSLAKNMPSPTKTRTTLEPERTAIGEFRASTIVPLSASTIDTAPNSPNRRQRSPSPSARVKPSPSARLKPKAVTTVESRSLTASSPLRGRRSDRVEIDNSQPVAQEKSLRSTRTSLALVMEPRLSSPVRERRNSNVLGDKSTRSTRTSVTAFDFRTTSPPKGYRTDPRNEVSVRSATARTVAMEPPLRSSSPTRAERSLRASRTVGMEPRLDRTNEEKSIRATRTVPMEYMRASSPTREKRSQSEVVREKSLRTTRTVDMEPPSTSASRAHKSETELNKEKSHRGTRTVAMEQRSSSPSKRAERTVGNEYRQENSLRGTPTVPLEQRSPSPSRVKPSQANTKEKSLRGTRTVAMEPRSSSPSLRATRTIPMDLRSSSPTRESRLSRLGDKPDVKETSERSTLNTVAPQPLSSSSPPKAQRNNGPYSGANREPKQKDREEKDTRASLDSTIASSNRVKRSDGTFGGASSASKSPSKHSSKSVNDQHKSKQSSTTSIAEGKNTSSTEVPRSSSPLKINQGNDLAVEKTRGSYSAKSQPKRSTGVGRQLSSSLSMLDTSGIECNKSHRVVEQYTASQSKNKRVDDGLGSRSLHSYSSPKRTSKRMEASNGSSVPAENGVSSKVTKIVDPMQSSRSPKQSLVPASPAKRSSIDGNAFYSSSTEEAAIAGHQLLGEKESTTSLKEKMHSILSSPTPRAKAKLRRFQTASTHEDDDASISSQEEIRTEVNTDQLECPSSPPVSLTKRTSATVVIRKVHKSPMRARVKLPNFEDSIMSFADFDSFAMDEPSVTVQSDTAHDTDKLENMFRDMGSPQTTTRCSMSVKCRPHQDSKQVEYHLSPTAPSGIGNNIPLKMKNVKDVPAAKNLHKMMNTFDDKCPKSNRVDDGCVSITSGGSKKAMMPNVQPGKKVAKGNGTPIKPAVVVSPRVPGAPTRIDWVNSLSTPGSPKSSRNDSSRRHAAPSASLSGFGDSFFQTSSTEFSFERKIENLHDRNRWCSDPLAKRSAHQSTTASETSTRDSSIGFSSVSTFTDQESYGSSSAESDSNKDSFGVPLKVSSVPTHTKMSHRIKGPRTVQRQKSSDGTMLRKMRSNSIDSCSSATSSEFASSINKSLQSSAQGAPIKARRTMKIKKEKSVKHLGAKNPSRIRSRG